MPSHQNPLGLMSKGFPFAQTKVNPLTQPISLAGQMKLIGIVKSYISMAYENRLEIASKKQLFQESLIFQSLTLPRHRQTDAADDLFHRGPLLTGSRIPGSHVTGSLVPVRVEG